ncbi:MAG: glycosyl transferase family 2, partial [Alphaproteobacteria bacterium]
LNDAGHVTELREKQPISDEATVGIYNFATGAEFVAAADAMISKNIRTNNEFYVAPVYNEMIAAGQLIDIFNIGAVGDGMYGLGTPADLDAFLQTDIAARLAKVS